MQRAEDVSEVLNVVNQYFIGMYQRDMSLLKEAFHPNACLFGHLMGAYEHLTVQQWMEKISQAPIPAEVGEEYRMHVISFDINDTIATVKVHNFYHGLNFTDYLSLLKQESRWQIVNKTFCHQ